MKLLNLTLKSNQAVSINVEQIAYVYPYTTGNGLIDGSTIVISYGVSVIVNEDYADIVNLFTQLTTGKEARSTNVSRKS